MYSRGIQGEKKRRYCGQKGGEVEKRKGGQGGKFCLPSVLKGKL